MDVRKFICGQITEEGSAYCILMESQNQRLVKSRRDLKDCLVPSPLLQAGTGFTRQGCSAPSDLVLNTSKDLASAASLGSLGQDLTTITIIFTPNILSKLILF